MAQTVTLPNNDTLEFPDDMDPRLIEAHVKKFVNGQPQQYAKSRLLMPPQFGGPMLPDVAMGARQVLDAAAQLAARGAESVANRVGGSDALTKMRENTETANREAFSDYTQRFAPEAAPGSSVARGVGQAMVTAPFLPALKAGGVLKSAAGGAGMGAGTSALTPIYDIPQGSTFWDEKAKQAGEGAIVGGALGGAGSAFAKLLAPRPQEGARELLDKGVRLTPGQTFGGAANYVEQKIGNFPGVGNIVQNARKQSIHDFNRVLYQRALEPWGDAGKAVVKQTEVGRKGIADVGKFIGQRYDEALAQSVPSPVDPSFFASFKKLETMVPRAKRGDFKDIVNGAIEITPANTITPSALKSAESKIGQRAAGYTSSSVEDERQLGYALREAVTELRELMARYNPETAKAIRAADQGYRTLVQIENAGAMLGSKDGVITPAAFLNAVRRSDKSVRKRAFAKGEAYNQAMADNAKNILPQNVPESGTPGGIALLGAIANPVAAAKMGAGMLPALAMYAPGSSAAFRALLTRRPQGAELARDLLGKTSPYLGALSGGLLSAGQ